MAVIQPSWPLGPKRMLSGGHRMAGAGKKQTVLFRTARTEARTFPPNICVRPTFFRTRPSGCARSAPIYEQSAVLGERREIAVCVQQWYTTRDAPGRDQAIDRLAHGNPAPTQAAIVIHGRERRRRAADLNLREGEQRAACRVVLPVVGNPAQYFQQHQVADKDLSRIVLARIGV